MKHARDRRLPRHRRATLVTTERLRGERGASLVVALALILVLAVSLSAVLAYTTTVWNASNTYRDQRVDRYSADAAIEAAIDYVRDQPDMGRDPEYSDADPPCVYNVPTQAGTIAVTCDADPGSDSGVPLETGKVPDHAILALGDRHNEVKPYNRTDCKIAGVPFGQDGPESSIYFEPGGERAYFENGDPFTLCGQRVRTVQDFNVQGSIVARGKISAWSGAGTLTSQDLVTEDGTIPGSVRAGFGCGLPVSPSCENANGSTTFMEDVAVDPREDKPVEWAPVPLLRDGDGNIVYRDRPYRWDGDSLEPIATNADPATTCAQGRTIVFQPGWYRDANTLNKWTSSPDCKDVTVWLAPDAGADGQLLTDDDKTGAYYLGFTEGSGTNCGFGQAAATNTHRWCIGGTSADISARVVVGTPKDWNPLAYGGTVATREVVIRQASVQRGISQTWFDTGGASRTNDGQVAYYSPTALVCPSSFLCWSDDRSIMLGEFQTQATAPPDRDAHRINVRVRHGEYGTGLSTPKFEVRVKGGSSCPQTYEVPSHVVNTQNVAAASSQLAYGTFRHSGQPGSETAAAESLADCLDSIERIRNAEIVMRVTGNTTNQGMPRVFLDGFEISYISKPEAAFPVESENGPEAVNDCDKSLPGGQLIFGGDSHVYVADGSLEVCAGPYPENEGDHQQIGIYGVPAPDPIRPNTDGVTTTVTGNINGNSASATVSSPSNLARIAEPEGSDNAGNGTKTSRFRVSKGGPCVNGKVFYGLVIGIAACRDQYQGTATIPAQVLDVPPGLKVARVDARLTYNANNPCLVDGDSLSGWQRGLWEVIRGWFGNDVGCIGKAPTIQFGNCNPQTLDRTRALTQREFNVFQDGGTNCYGGFNNQQQIPTINATYTSRHDQVRCQFAFGLPFIPGAWAGVGDDFECGEWFGFGSTKDAYIDGVEYVVTYAQDDDPSTPIVPVPQSGCIVDYPNYWEGAGSPDCAVVKSDTVVRNVADWLDFINVEDWLGLESEKPIGRISVQGTIYAPTAAIDVDDQDVAYPLATRGVVARHLRIKGFRQRDGYNGPAISTVIDDTRRNREVTFVACERGEGRTAADFAEPCSPTLDRILTKARVNFSYLSKTESQPEVIWWSDER